jgi:predicted nucleotidyltransferase
MVLADTLKAKRDDVLRVAAQKRGACRIRVFGSVARGDARPDSDIDFLVEMEPGRSLIDLGGLVSDLQELLGRDVDVVTERGLKPRIRARLLAEAVPL